MFFLYGGNFQIPFSVHLLKLIRVCTMFPSRGFMVNVWLWSLESWGSHTQKCNPTHPLSSVPQKWGEMIQADDLPIAFSQLYRWGEKNLSIHISWIYRATQKQ